MKIEFGSRRSPLPLPSAPPCPLTSREQEQSECSSRSQSARPPSCRYVCEYLSVCSSPRRSHIGSQRDQRWNPIRVLLNGCLASAQWADWSQKASVFELYPLVCIAEAAAFDGRSLAPTVCLSNSFNNQQSCCWGY